MLPTDYTNNNSKRKYENLIGRNSPFYWKSLPKYIINMTEYLERAKSYVHLIREDGLLVDLQKLQKVKKGIVSVFVGDKFSRKVIAPQNTPSLDPWCFWRWIIRRKRYFMWDVLSPTPANCEDASNWNLIMKDLIIKTEFVSWRKTMSQYLISFLWS